MDYDVIIIGAGASGLMCAIEAGKRGRRVWLVDHAKKTAEKIRISGGGRCNFTNIHTQPDNFLSQNPHFCKSILARYTQDDFIALVKEHQIPFHEKKLGQLFCDESAKDIIAMLLNECEAAGVKLSMETSVESITHEGNQFTLKTSRGDATCRSLVIATGGLSIPKIGATKFGYDIAHQFGHSIIPTRAALVPLTFSADMLERCKNLSGLSVDATVTAGKTTFREGLLFTHRGLSGPSILQISSYWQEGESIRINLCPDVDAEAFLKHRKEQTPKQDIQTVLSDLLPKRLAIDICEHENIQGKIAEISHKTLNHLAQCLNVWEIKPSGTEGYRTAEVTLGGVNTDELNPKTLESKKQSGLYFIGEVIDVTGHLGGFNFQWAWSSGFVAGQYI